MRIRIFKPVSKKIIWSSTTWRRVAWYIIIETIRATCWRRRMHWRWRKQILVEYLCETEKWWVKYGKMTWSEGKWSGLEWSEVKWSKTKWWHWLNVCVLSLIFSNIVYVGSVHYVVSLFDAFLCYFLIRWLMFLNIPCMFVFCFVYLFYFCVFCVSVLFLYGFVYCFSYCAVSFLFLYTSTDHYHRVET